MTKRFFAIGDIHGECDKFEALLTRLFNEAKMDLTIDELVQLGDKNDRGPDTYKVFERLKDLKTAYPDNVHAILGNHEDMMIQAAKEVSAWSGDNLGLGRSHAHAWDLLMRNGGHRTVRSYADVTAMYGKGGFPRGLVKTGHWDFLREHLTFLETEDYFFSHAPIPKNREGKRGFREDLETLIWSYFGESVGAWVDHNLIPGKKAISGHIHGMRQDRGTGKIEIPGVRTYGSSYLIDTGCGCHPDGYLTALELPSGNVYTSRGDTIRP